MLRFAIINSQNLKLIQKSNTQNMKEQICCTLLLILFQICIQFNIQMEIDSANSHFLQAETRRLKAYFRQHPSQLVGCRVIFGGHQAVVKFFGKLQEGDKHGNDLWVGVRWDDTTRGKHNGTVNGHTYFECEQGAGSMVRYEKIEFGYKVQAGFFRRYFRNEEMYAAKTIYDQLQVIKKTSKNEVEKKQARDELGRRKVHIEYDSQAYVQTFKNNKVMVEFVGFDEIWNKIHNLDEVVNINLPDVHICDLGGEGVLRNMFPKVEIFSLEKNFLHDWDQAYLVGHQLQHLQQFILTKNKLKQPQDALLQKNISIMYSDKVIQVSPINIFKNLKSMVLIDTDLNWKILFKVYPSFPNVEELVLCRNKIWDYENIIFDQQHSFKNLKFLNLQQTQMTDQHFEGLKKLKDLPILERLILNRNKLRRFGVLQGFKSLKCLSLEYNQIEVPLAISQISKLTTLQYFNIKHNPVADKLGVAYVRQRSVAQLPNLKWINNSDLKKYQRKDYEIYYMKEVFHQYFNLKKVPDYDYDYEDFLKWTQTLHPNVTRLIKIYGIPYEPQKKQIVKLIQEEMPINSKKAGSTCDIKIQIRSGPGAGTNTYKKVALSWSLSNLKNLISKTMKIPAKNQKLSYKLRQTSDQELLQDEHKQLLFFNLNQKSIIIVDYVG